MREIAAEAIWEKSGEKWQNDNDLRIFCLGFAGVARGVQRECSMDAVTLHQAKPNASVGRERLTN
jgi:hypothetical protein